MLRVIATGSGSTMCKTAQQTTDHDYTDEYAEQISSLEIPSQVHEQVIRPTGRVTLNQIALATTGVTLNFQLYLDGNGNGLVIGVDGFQVTEGLAYVQNSSNPPLNGTYALSVQGLTSSGSFSAVGPVSVVSGAFSGTTDYNNNGTLQPATPLGGSQHPTAGTLNLTGLSGDTTTQSGWGYYPVDSSLTIAIEVDGQQLGLLFLEANSQ